jgi:serine/threonine protein kinase
LASGLLDQEQLDAAWDALRAATAQSDALPTEEQLAEKLVELGRLNAWQSKQLLQGRTKFNLGPYWMIDSIGRGGMGQVFKARHEVLDRVVAVKVLPRSKSTPESVADFTREIQVLAKLDHPNLVRALDAGEDGNVCYLVTEYVPGTDLRKLVRRHGPMSMQAAAGVISQVAAGLQHAHEQGMVHRDVKPGNVLVTASGNAKLSDLGLASPLGGDARDDARFGKIVGTADYLSPDHIQAPWNPTPAWDIYSLGCTLYYAVTGKVPFPGGTIADKVRAARELRPLDPRRLNAALTVPFVELMADMMAKDPAERIQTAGAVIARLAPWVGTPTPVLAGDRPSVRPQSWATTPSEATRATPAAEPEAADPDQPGLNDTQSSFPEIPEASPGQSDYSGSQTTHPFASGAQDTSSTMRFPDAEPTQPLPIFHPIVVLVLFPVTLVGLVLLVWWVFQSLT